MNARPAHEALGLRFDRLSPAGGAALVLALAALWLLGRRYGGITHDASIYVLQGLRALEPQVFARDLFFVYGAQDAYTVFPRLYALLIGTFGAGHAALMVTIAGQLGFLAAAAALVFRLVRGPARWWSLALLAVVSGYYGGAGVFRIAEPFASARTLAEPLVVAALAGTLGARHVAAFAALALAALLHPLVAASGIAVVFVWHAMARPRLLWTIPALFCAAVLGAAWWPGLALRFDAQWLAAVVERSPHLFLSQWQQPDWSRLLWGYCVARIALRHLEAPARRLVVAVGITTLAGIVASGIAVDLLGDVFAAGLQMWRAHWLLQFSAIVLVPVAAAGLWRSGAEARAARAAAACIAASCCFGRAELPAAAVLAVLAVALDVSERLRPRWMQETAFRALLLAVIAAAAVGLMFEIQTRLPAAYGASRLPIWTDNLQAATTVGGLLPLAVLLWLAAHSRRSLAAAGAAAAVLALGIVAWDARTPLSRFLERAGGHANPFRAAVRPGAVVFWPGPHARVWLAMGTPTWFSVDQGAGIVFSRQTAMEYERRKLQSHALRAAMEYCDLLATQDCHIDVQAVRALCDWPGGPDYAVLNAALDGRRAVEWILPRDSGPVGRTYRLYACRDLAGAPVERGTK